MKLYSGKIPLGIRPSTYGDRVILTGDAAGFVKPLSGGGLYPAFKANKHIVEAVSTGLDTDAFYSRDLSEYGRKCYEDFGRELDRSYFLRKRFKRLSDADMNKVYDYIKKNDLEPILNEIDLDHPSELVNRISRNPKAVLSVLPLFLRTIR
jgi:flavin-dependent dehydrogenase